VAWAAGDLKMGFAERSRFMSGIAALAIPSLEIFERGFLGLVCLVLLASGLTGFCCLVALLGLGAKRQ